ncbi:MAG: hypothetical protein WAV47_16115, partial [Blastocatellia bacterium]
MKSPLRLVKYVIGLSVAFLAVSNCFSVLSNSSSPTYFQVDNPSSVEQQARDHYDLNRAFKDGATRGRGSLNPSRSAEGIPDISMLTRVAAVTSTASPFAPLITATK